MKLMRSTLPGGYRQLSPPVLDAARTVRGDPAFHALAIAGRLADSSALHAPAMIES